MCKTKSKKGITLVSLVITIIVMLILVAVTITMAINGGLFDYAQKAVDDMENVMAREDEVISELEEYINSNQENVKSEHNSIYIWRELPFFASNVNKTIQCLNYLEVTDLYYSIGVDELDSEDANRIIKLNKNGFNVYLLTGKSSYYNNADKLKEYIDAIYNYNLNCNYDEKITGVVFDIECYFEEEYKQDEITGFEVFADSIATVYNYAKDKNINIVITIPYWYDNYMLEDEYSEEEKTRAQNAFEKLIMNCDRISVMNYYKTKMVEHIETEIQYAMKYGKEIESIAEFQRPKGEGMPTTISLWVEDNPIEYAREKWSAVSEKYKYEKLNFSYHHLNELLEICGGYQNIKFEFITTDSNVIEPNKIKILGKNMEIEEIDNNEDIVWPKDQTYDLILDDYKVIGLIREEDLGDNTIKKVYQVQEKELNILEIYVEFSTDNNINLSETTLIIQNNITGEKNSYSYKSGGFFYAKDIEAEVPYKITLITNNGDVLELSGATAKNVDGNKVSISDDNGNIIIPSGFDDDFYIGPTFTF